MNAFTIVRVESAQRHPGTSGICARHVLTRIHYGLRRVNAKLERTKVREIKRISAFRRMNRFGHFSSAHCMESGKSPIDSLGRSNLLPTHVSSKPAKSGFFPNARYFDPSEFGSGPI